MKYRDLYDYGLVFFIEMITKEKSKEILDLELENNRIDIDKIIEILDFKVEKISFNEIDFNYNKIQDDTETIYINTDENMNEDITKTVEMIYNLYYFKFLAERLARGQSLEDIVVEFASLSEVFALSFLLPDKLVEKIIKENLSKKRVEAIKDETGLPEDFIERKLFFYEDSKTKC